MPIIPMYNTPADADAWHEVTAPGGYEWWHFDAEDAAGEIRILIRFHVGHAFDPGYLRAYQQYRRSPTRVAPPMPSRYPAVEFTAYRGEELLVKSVTNFSAQQFKTSASSVDLCIGENCLQRLEDGSLQIRLAEGTFRFAPKLTQSPIRRGILSREWSEADHQWVLVHPLCDVSGELTLHDRTIPFHGLGYHDHRLGSGPIGTGLKRWMRGRVLMPDHAVMFHFAQPADARIDGEVVLLESSHLVQQELDVNRFNADWNSRSSSWLRYPSWVETGPLKLAKPTVLEATPQMLRVVYEASVRGVESMALCDIVYAQRWRMWGR